MMAVTISKSTITFYQNLSPILRLELDSFYLSNYNITLGSCDENLKAARGFAYYYAVFDSDSIQKNYFSESPSDFCFYGLDSCEFCENSFYLDFIGKFGCISTDKNILDYIRDKEFEHEYLYDGDSQINCLCNSKSCYYNLSNEIECLNITTRLLQRTQLDCLDSGCLPCPGSDCISCIADFTKIIDNSCVCIDGYYSDNYLVNKDSCHQCNLGCALCDSDLSCTKCIVGYYKKSESLMYESCSLCRTGCQNCTSDDDCDQCIAVDAIIKDGICECKEGFYSVGEPSKVDSCLPCNSNCKTCLDSISCTACKIDNSEPSVDFCSCKQGYYAVKDFSNNLVSCNKCKSLCLSCSDSASCNICIEFSFKIKPSDCKCIEGYYQKSEISNQDSCQPCPSYCLTCSESDFCDTCLAENSQVTYKGCACKQGFYAEGSMNLTNACHKCKDVCLSCHDGFGCDECLTKNSGVGDDGECKCLDGFYSDGPLDQGYSCNPCNPDCSECYNLTHCISCRSKNSVPSIIGCECQTGFYSSNASSTLQCLKCNENCLNCTDPLKCEDCDPGFSNINGKCIKSCDKNCESCGSDWVCQKCKGNNLYFNETQGTCGCLQGFWLDSNQSTCKPCSDLCKTCMSDLECNKCIDGSILKSGNCSCKKGYIRDKNSCIKGFFQLKVSLSKSNRINLEFSENLESPLTPEMLLITIQSNLNYSSKLISKSKNRVYLIALNFKESIQKPTKLTIALLKKPILSYQGYVLNAYKFELTLNEFDYIDPSITSLIEAIRNIGPSVVITAASTSFNSPKTLWSLINTLMFIIYLPLNQKLLTSAMNKLCQNLLSIQLVPNFLLYIIDVNDSNLPKELKDCGMESFRFWVNFGSSLTILASFIVFWPFFICLSKFQVKWLSEKCENYVKNYKFNFFIKFWLQSYLEIGIFALISFNNMNDFSSKTWIILDYFTSVIILVKFI